MKLPRCYLVIDDVQWLHRLLPLGLKLVQLRIKTPASPAWLREQIRQAKQLCDAHQALLVVNDHWQFAIDEQCDWVHLGQEDLQRADMAAIRRAGLKLGVSTHSHAELECALAVSPDYVALGPIWATTSKQMPWKPQGLERITDWKQRVGAIPLVAIGGLTIERAPAALQAGADSLAMISDVCRHPQPEQRLQAWLAVTS